MEASRLGATASATTNTGTPAVATVDPASIRVSERRAAGQFSNNGVALDPLDETVANGYALAARRAEITIAALRTLALPLTAAGAGRRPARLPRKGRFRPWDDVGPGEVPGEPSAFFLRM